MNAQQQGHFIKDPRTQKTLSVSRDVFNALKYAEEKAKGNQQDMSEYLKNITQSLVKKIYLAETRDMKTAFRFNERGQVDEINTVVELTTPNLSAEQMMMQYTMCLNQAIEQKACDLEKKFKEKAEQKAA